MKNVLLSFFSLLVFQSLNSQLTSDNIGFTRNGTSYSPFKGRFKAVAVFPDGRILAGGEIDGPGRDYDFTLIAYNSQGIRDKSFGKDGIVQTDLEKFNDRLSSILMLPNGKFIAAGSANPYGKNTMGAMVKYEPNGSLDQSFGSNGVVRIPAGQQNLYIEKITQQKDGKILLTGTMTDNYGSRLVVYRFMANGSPDPAFGNKGSVELPNINANAHSITVLPSGKIAVTGMAGYSPSKYILVALLTPAGKWDPLFANKGVYEHRKTINDESPGGIMALPDGRLMVTGSSINMNQLNKDSVLVFRLLANGKPDHSFGIRGDARYRFAARSNLAKAILLQPDQKILVIGTTSTDKNTRGMAIRLHPNGNRDTTFGIRGIAILGFDQNTQDYIDAATLQPDGKLVLAGYSKSGMEWPAIGRLTANGEVDKGNAAPGPVPTVITPPAPKTGTRLLNASEYAELAKSMAGEYKRTITGTIVAEGYLDGGNTIAKYKTISANAAPNDVFLILAFVKYSAPVQIKIPGPNSYNVTCNGDRITDAGATVHPYHCRYVNNTGQQRMIQFEINVQNSMEPGYYLVIKAK